MAVATQGSTTQAGRKFYSRDWPLSESYERRWRLPVQSSGSAEQRLMLFVFRQWLSPIDAFNIVRIPPPTPVPSPLQVPEEIDVSPEAQAYMEEQGLQEAWRQIKALIQESVAWDSLTVGLETFPDDGNGQVVIVFVKTRLSREDSRTTERALVRRILERLPHGKSSGFMVFVR